MSLSERRIVRTASPQQRAGKASFAAIRQMVLVGILLLLGGAAAYDHFIARAGLANADKKIQEMAEANMTGGGTATLTNAEIQKALGKSPAVIQQSDNDYAEKFVWIAGLPWRQYYVWVLYSGRNKVYRTHVVNEDLFALRPENNAKPVNDGMTATTSAPSPTTTPTTTPMTAP